MAKCLAIFLLSTTAPTAKPISAALRKGEFLRRISASTRASARSVAASKSSRLRALSAARSRLRHTIKRSPGNSSGALISARSRSSNNDQLQRPVLAGQRLYRRSAQAGDPIKPRRLEIIADARRGDHSAIADQYDPADRE